VLPTCAYLYCSDEEKLKHCCSQWLLSLCCDHCKNREEMKLLDETLFPRTYSLLVILPVVLCRWDSWLFTCWEEYRMMVMSESRVWRTCWQGRQYCLLILCERHSLLTFGRPQVRIFLLETNDPDWFFVVFLSPLSQMQGHCLKLGHTCFLPSFHPFIPSFFPHPL